MSHKDNIKFFWVKHVITLAIVCMACWVVYQEITVHHHQLFEPVYWQKMASMNKGFFIIHLIVLVLMVVNWGLEASKWKLIVGQISTITFLEAYKGVLCGLGVSLFSPRFFGESVGRVFHLSNQNREQAIAGLLISRLGQFYITLIMGGVSLLFFTNVLVNKELYLEVSIVVLFMMTLVVTIRGKIIGFLANWFSPKIIGYLQMFKEAKTQLLIRVFVLSFLRYMVFLLQFILVFLAFEQTPLVIDLSIAVAVFFLVRSVMVSINVFLDYAVRLSSAIVVLNNLVDNTENVVMVVSIVWVINVIIPSLIGSVFMKDMKLKVRMK